MTYEFIVGNGVKTDPYVDGIGHTVDINSSTYGPGQRHGYTIHYILKGKGRFNGRLVNKNQGFIVYDGMISEHAADKNDPWELLWITLYGNSMEEIFAQYDVDPALGIFNYFSLQIAEDTINLIRNCKAPAMNATELLEIFMRLHNDYIKKKGNKSLQFDIQNYVDWATHYIHANIHRDITINELTKRLGISQPYLYTLFKQRFNLSPKQYIINKKLALSKELLINTNMKITEIANSIGYYDLFTFSKMFHSKEKLSPQEYRKKHTIPPRKKLTHV